MPEDGRDWGQFCSQHIDLVKEMTVVHTKQDTVMENQDRMMEQLTCIQKSMDNARITSTGNLAEIKSDIIRAKFNLRPLHLSIGAGVVGAIAELVHWLHRVWR